MCYFKIRSSVKTDQIIEEQNEPLGSFTQKIGLARSIQSPWVLGGFVALLLIVASELESLGHIQVRF